MGTRPDAYTMAFGGEDTGNTTATEAARPAETAGIIGSTPAACAIEITIGIAMLVAAVFDIVSVSTTVKSAAANVSVVISLVGTKLVIPSPTTRARPVDAVIIPSDKPPPNSKIVPQSI